jgi:ribosome-associated protein
LTSKEKALALAEALNQKKGFDVRILDLRGTAAFTNFFVIATGASDRHVRTLADSAFESARLSGQHLLGTEGEKTARWILIDVGDVVVHVFQREARDFYGLERLWGDAAALELPQVAGALQ